MALDGAAVSLTEQHPDRASWLAARGVGASDVAAILGIGGRAEDEPHRTAWDVWARLTDQAGPPHETEAMARGRRWEPLVLGCYRGETGNRIEVRPHMLGRHPTHKWATASPDALVLDGFEAGKVVGGVEAKTDASPARAAWGDSTQIPRWDDQAARLVRPDYALQAYWQAWVCGFAFVDLCVLLPWYDFRVFRLHADFEVFAALEEQIGRWHRRHVVNGEPPSIDGSDACLDWLRDRFPGGEGRRLATEDEAGMVRRYAALKAATRAAEDEVRDLRARLLDAAGNSDRIDLTDGPKPPRLTVIRSERAGGWDVPRLLADHPEIDADRYRKGPSITVQLRTYNVEKT